MLFGAVGLPLLLNPEGVGKEAISVVKYVFFVFFGYSLRVIISFSTRSRRRLKSLRRAKCAERFVQVSYVSFVDGSR